MGTISWVIYTVIIFGTVLLSHYLGRQIGYERGYYDGEEVGYVEGYLARNHANNPLLARYKKNRISRPENLMG